MHLNPSSLLADNLATMHIKSWQGSSSPSYTKSWQRDYSNLCDFISSNPCLLNEHMDLFTSNLDLGSPSKSHDKFPPISKQQWNEGINCNYGKGIRMLLEGIDLLCCDGDGWMICTQIVQNLSQIREIICLLRSSKVVFRI